MNKHILMPEEPTQEMLSSAMAVCTGFSGDYGRYNDHLSEDAAREVYQAFRSVAPAVQAEPVGWQFYEDGKWWNGDDRIKDHRKNTEAAGVPVRDVYADPRPATDAPVPEIIEAVANFVGSQEGGPFTPAVIKAAIIGQLRYGDVFTKLLTSPAPKSAEQPDPQK